MAAYVVVACAIPALLLLLRLLFQHCCSCMCYSSIDVVVVVEKLFVYLFLTSDLVSVFGARHIWRTSRSSFSDFFLKNAFFDFHKDEEGQKISLVTKDIGRVDIWPFLNFHLPFVFFKCLILCQKSLCLSQVIYR